jgi:hypothetical protein
VSDRRFDARIKVGDSLTPCRSSHFRSSTSEFRRADTRVGAISGLNVNRVHFRDLGIDYRAQA